MQYFKSQSSGEVYAYNDDVTVAIVNGVSTVTTAAGVKLTSAPTDLQPYTPPTPTAAELLAQSQLAQIAAIQAACEQTENAPLAFTNAAGTATTYPMDAGSRQKYLGAYTKYVVHGQALPSPFSFMDVNGNLVAFTVADIDSFSNPAFTQEQDAVNKLGSLIAQVKAATTVADVQAITW